MNAAGDTPSRSILIVTYSFPPCGDTGAHRPTSMARHLAGLGHQVTVLTTAVYGEGGEPEGVEVERTWDLRLLQARLSGQRRLKDTFESDVQGSRPHWLNRIVVPEPLTLTWGPFALARGLRIGRRFDCVITSSPPECVHLVGWALRRAGVPWIADVRDAWNFEALKQELSGPLQRLDDWMERRAFRAADVVTCNTAPVVEDMRERLGANAVRISSGWDPALAGDNQAGSGIDLDPERLSLVYTGRFATYSRDPSGLLEAMAKIGDSEPELARRLELVFAGPYTERELELLGGDFGPLKVRVVGSLPRERALALQREAEALLIVLSPERRQAAPIKLFEYVGTGRPIVALAEGTAGGDVVRELDAGVLVDSTDPAAIVEALRRLAGGGVPVVPEAALGDYVYPRAAELMAEQVERAISDRAGREGRGRTP